MKFFVFAAHDISDYGFFMRLLALICILFLNSTSATNVLIFDEANLDKEQKLQLFNLILRGEPPRIFYDSTPFDLKLECQKLAPSLHLKWIPPTLWQLAVLHAFFHEQEVRKGILAFSGYGWEPFSYDEMLHLQLPLVQSIEEIAEYFDQQTQSLSKLCELFFQVNKAVSSLCKRAGGCDLEIMRLAISELPPFNEWQEKQFPFWKSPWIYNPNSVRIFYNALKDESLLSELLKIERIAHENGEWVLYRGYDSSGYPSTLQQEDVSSHALSFGSTLLGGTFFSLEASALAYSKSDTSITHSFLALRVSPQELREIFRVGPLHPFVQMLVDGEMFHAHTKIASNTPDKYKNNPLNGYFMKCNRHCNDPIGYILSLKMTPEELERSFFNLCEQSGYIFSNYIIDEKF